MPPPSSRIRRILLARTAAVLGKADDRARYEALLEKIKAAFVKEFVTPEGRVGENTQTAYVLALQFDLLPDGAAALGRRRGSPQKCVSGST